MFRIKTLVKMKIILIILSIALSTLLQGCSSSYYQLYEVGTDVTKTQDALVYSDENCDVIYNLWAKSGSMDFIFTNKTDNDIYIDLTHSFFIQNGIAYDYYSDKEYTSTTTVSEASTASLMASYKHAHSPHMWTPTSISKGANISSTVVSAHSASITTKASKYIYIPARASKVVRSFRITDYCYLTCDNNDFNRPRKESEKIIYSKDESPLQFRNRIVYTIDDCTHYIDNCFWIASVKNYNKNHLFVTQTEKDCFSNFIRHKKVFRISGVDMFYNDYKVESINKTIDPVNKRKYGSSI